MKNRSATVYMSQLSFFFFSSGHNTHAGMFHGRWRIIINGRKKKEYKK
jgi:hypothetical protein